MSLLTSLSRRNILRGSATLIAGSLVACAGETEFQQGETVLTASDVWTERANRLEALNVYSEANPPADPMSNKPAAHLPEVIIENGYVTAIVDHVMQPAHWITTIYFRDQDGKVFYLKELVPSDVDTDEAGNPKEKGVSAYTKIPTGTTSISAFAFCNLHEHWYSGVKMV